MPATLTWHLGQRLRKTPSGCRVARQASGGNMVAGVHAELLHVMAIAGYDVVK
jgi:hypothetical protein